MRPLAIRYVLDAQQKLLEENSPQGKTVLSPEVPYVITHMLEGTIERGTGTAAKALGRPAAAKTGTTNDYSNAWFIGYTPKLATGVWVGYDRPRSLGRDETGSRVAVPIWTAFMSEALAGTGPVDFAGAERVVIVPSRPVSFRRLRAPGGDGLRRGDGSRRSPADRRSTLPLPPRSSAPSPPIRRRAPLFKILQPQASRQRGSADFESGDHHSPDSSAGQTLGPHPDPLAGRDSNCYAKLPGGDGDVCRRPPKSA